VSWLLDTCVFSELVRPRPKASVVRWIRERDEDDLFLSVITIGELEKGIAKLPDSSKRATLEQWVRRELADRFRGRLLVIDSRIAARWGTLVGVSEAHGPQHDLTVVTRNTDDLERCGASCVNPWAEK
jgi:predicted nucleic acid-binding protein